MRRCFYWLVIFSFLSFAKGQSSATSGVLVEAPGNPTSKENGGLQKGDVILTSSITAHHVWTVESPLTLEWLASERGGQGAILLRGIRKGRPRTWMVQTQEWAIVTAPRRPEWSSLRETTQALREAKRFDDLVSVYKQWAARLSHDPDLRLWTLLDAARWFMAAHDRTHAEPLFAEALTSYRSATVAAQSRMWVAYAAFLEQSREFERAKTVLQNALRINATLAPHGFSQAAILHKLAETNWHSRNSLEGMKHIQNELQIRSRSVHDLPYAKALYYAGMFAIDQGRFAEAAGYQSRAFRLFHALAPTGIDMGHCYLATGTLASLQGDLSRAEELFSKAVTVFTAIDPRSPDLGGAWNNLGIVAEQQGNLPQSAKCFQQALEIKRGASSIEDCIRCGSSLDNLAIIRLEQADFPAADHLIKQAIKIETRYYPDSSYLAEAFNTAARIRQGEKRLSEAEQFYHAALGILDRLYPTSIVRADAQAGLADVLIDKNELAPAKQYAEQALALRTVLTPHSGQLAVLLGSLAKIERLQQHAAAAQAYYQRSLTVLDRQVAENPAENNAQLRAKYASLYVDYVGFLVQEGDPARALEVLEQMRARTLLQMLQDAEVNLATDNPATTAQRSQLLGELAAQSNMRVKLLEAKDTKAVAAVDQNIESTLARLNHFDHIADSRHPRARPILNRQTLSATEIQGLLDHQTMLLSYLISENASYLFAITSAAISVYPLPKGDVLTGSGKRLYDLYATPPSPSKATVLGEEQARAAQDFARSIFPAKALAGFSDKFRILIVPDGILNYLPLGSLPMPGTARTLLSSHEVITIPSASAWSALRREQEAPYSKPSASLIVFADPVFSPSDARVTHAPELAANRAPSSDALRSGGRTGFSRLAFSRDEADYISSLVSRAKPNLDFDASRQRVLRSNFQQYNTIHFATHGILDTTYPQLSALVLSLVDQKGKPLTGFLTLQDIYRLRLRPGSLVVLSGCQTALGAEVKGEGLVGLTRGFMYAGATKVIASLWKVDDAATAELMRKFYEVMKRDPTISTASALRQAQVKLSQIPRWASPYYWAAFTYEGDWR